MRFLQSSTCPPPSPLEKDTLRELFRAREGELFRELLRELFRDGTPPPLMPFARRFISSWLGLGSGFRV